MEEDARWSSDLVHAGREGSGAQVGSQLAPLVAGAPAPIIAVALLGSFEDPDPGRVAIYIAVCSVITIAAVLSCSETGKRDLAADDALVPETAAAGR